MTGSPDNPHSTTSGFKHWLGFLVSGTIAFCVDASVLKLLMAVAGWSPFPSRVVSILLAMVVGWLCHRTFTFAVVEKPSWRELVRYLGVQALAAILNFAIFTAVLFLRPQTDPLIAVFVASGVQMVASYFGLRFGAFGKRAS